MNVHQNHHSSCVLLHPVVSSHGLFCFDGRLNLAQGLLRFESSVVSVHLVVSCSSRSVCAEKVIGSLAEVLYDRSFNTLGILSTGVAAKMTIAPDGRPALIPPPRWTLLANVLDVAIETGGAGPDAAVRRRTTGDGHVATADLVQARRLSLSLLIRRGEPQCRTRY